MSTAAPASHSSSGYSIHRPRGTCTASGEPIAPGETFVAGLRETTDGFERVDVRLPHWDAFDKSPLIAHWRTTMPTPDAPAKRSPFVDDQTLLDLLIRLADVTEPDKLAFRFVLTLILMRKRLVSYESTSVKEGRDVWRVKLRGRDEVLDIVDAKPTEAQIASVQTMLGQILSEEAA